MKTNVFNFFLKRQKKSIIIKCGNLIKKGPKVQRIAINCKKKKKVRKMAKNTKNSPKRPKNAQKVQKVQKKLSKHGKTWKGDT